MFLFVLLPEGTAYLVALMWTHHGNSMIMQYTTIVGSLMLAKNVIIIMVNGDTKWA